MNVTQEEWDENVKVVPENPFRCTFDGKPGRQKLPDGTILCEDCIKEQLRLRGIIP